MSPTPPPTGRDLTSSVIDALLVDTSPWLSCDDCFARMDSYAEAVVKDPAHVDDAMSAHLRGCGACDEEAESLIALIAADGS
jgi:hypothetical protein